MRKVNADYMDKTKFCPVQFLKSEEAQATARAALAATEMPGNTPVAFECCSTADDRRYTAGSMRFWMMIPEHRGTLNQTLKQSTDRSAWVWGYQLIAAGDISDLYSDQDPSAGPETRAERIARAICADLDCRGDRALTIVDGQIVWQNDDEYVGTIACLVDDTVSMRHEESIIDGGESYGAWMEELWGRLREKCDAGVFASE